MCLSGIASYGLASSDPEPEPEPGLTTRSAMKAPTFPIHLGLIWLAMAAFLCFALLLSLRDVMQSELEQGRLRRAIEATVVEEARVCRTKQGPEALQQCLKSLTERARASAATLPSECKLFCPVSP